MSRVSDQRLVAVDGGFRLGRRALLGHVVSRAVCCPGVGAGRTRKRTRTRRRRALRTRGRRREQECRGRSDRCAKAGAAAERSRDSAHAAAASDFTEQSSAESVELAGSASPAVVSVLSASPLLECVSSKCDILLLCSNNFLGANNETCASLWMKAIK